MTTPLYELDRDARPCPFAADDQKFESWQALRDNAARYDDHLNVVIWWDWYAPDDFNGKHEFNLMVALPNRERVYPWSCTVTVDQEPEIRAWLQARLRRLMGYWQIEPSP